MWRRTNQLNRTYQLDLYYLTAEDIFAKEGSVWCHPKVQKVFSCHCDEENLHQHRAGTCTCAHRTEGRYAFEYC